MTMISWHQILIILKNEVEAGFKKKEEQEKMINDGIKFNR